MLLNKVQKRVFLSHEMSILTRRTSDLAILSDSGQK